MAPSEKAAPVSNKPIYRGTSNQHPNTYENGGLTRSTSPSPSKKNRLERRFGNRTNTKRGDYRLASINLSASRATWRAGPSPWNNWPEMKAPSMSSIRPSPRISGSRAPMRRAISTRRLRSSRLCASATRRAGWSGSGYSTAALLSPQPRYGPAATARLARLSRYSRSCARGSSG
ncbi:hypothetical protein DK45_4361 [Bordetella bronchiseptica]|nr:hypothetical protein DK45_4361 [Bordetella bronchiseptica]